MSMARVPSFWLRHANRDIRTPISGQLQGRLPDWLRGALYRNGAAVKQIGQDRYNHLFDGLACVHKFNIDGTAGTVTYQNRFLESDSYRRNMAKNRIEVSEFGTLGREDLCRSLFGRLMSTYRDMTGKTKTTDNCSVNLAYFGTELYSMTETNQIWRINQQDLSADKKVNLSRVMTVNAATAHPHIGPDGTVYNIGNNFNNKAGPQVCFLEFPPGSENAAESGRVVATLPHRWPMEPSYFHSFGITDNYFVFVQQPLVIQVKKLAALKLKKKPLVQAIAGKPDQHAWIRLINRHTGQVHPTTFSADAFYIFHHVNAYEQDGNVVMDVCCQIPGEKNVIETVTVGEMSSEGEGEASPMRRFVLPLDSAKLTSERQPLPHCSATARPSTEDTSIYITPQTLNDPAHCRLCDLPRINYRYNGKPYRYAYACSLVGAAVNSDKLVKIDVDQCQSVYWSDPAWSPSEPVFVPAPSAGAEDDGVLLASLLHVQDKCRAGLLVLDAASMKERARAEFSTEDAVVAKDFHGLFAGSGQAVHAY